MFKRNDPYSFSRFIPLTNGISTDHVGTLTCEYQVIHYDDIQLNGRAAAKKKSVIKFLLLCTQKINIFNSDGMNLSPNRNLGSYDNYPVLINCLADLKTDANTSFELLDYSPQTVNTKVQSSAVNGTTDGQTSGFSTSSTVGSSTSQTNSYGATVSTESASVNYEHSSTTTQESSQTKGHETSKSQSADASTSANMSVKDWGAYALVNAATKNPSWSFGQEYPWDCIECRKTDGTLNPNNGNQILIVLPSAMSTRLYDGVSLYPPSQLSMFGFNFVMKATWLVSVNDGDTGDVTIEHTLNFFTATHALVPHNPPTPTSIVCVYMDQKPVILNTSDPAGLSTTLNLPLMAIDPLGTRKVNAIIGFIPNKFFTPPVPATASAAATPFAIMSTANNLLILDTTQYPAPSAADAGAGFVATESSLSSVFTTNCTSLQITIFAKVVDTVDDYVLFIKHWKAGSGGVVITLVINSDTANPIKKYVDENMTEGGEKNLLSITLRNQDYASFDYHDYLQLGLNAIQMTIEPINAADFANSTYQIRAISIE